MYSGILRSLCIIPHNIPLSMRGEQENSKIRCIKVETLEKGLVVTKNYKCERHLALITESKLKVAYKTLNEVQTDRHGNF